MSRSESTQRAFQPLLRILAPVAFVLVAGAATAQAPDPEPAPPRIHVTGEATVTASPDRAEIDLGVVTQAGTARAASQANAKRARALLEAIRELVESDAVVRTGSYSVRPEYRHPREGGRPEIVSFTATHVVHVETSRVERVGELVDAAVAAGANQIQRLELTLADEAELRAEALKRAAHNARAKADALAEALDLEILRVHRVQEGGVDIVPVRLEAARVRAEAAAVPTPVEAGPIELRAHVTLIVDVSP